MGYVNRRTRKSFSTADRRGPKLREGDQGRNQPGWLVCENGLFVRFLVKISQESSSRVVLLLGRRMSGKFVGFFDLG